VVDPDPRVAVLVGRHSAIDAISVRDASDLPREVEAHHPQAVIYNTLPGTQPAYASGIPESVVSFTCSLPSQSWIATNLQVAACLTKPVGIKELQAEMERFDPVRRVLVVDNDRGFCHLVERMIKSSRPDVRVEIALDGEEGLEALRLNPPDLLLLDLMMPVLDGFEVVDRMRSDPRLQNIPIILLTATSYGEDALNQRGSRIVIERGSGLHPAETLRCLHAILGELHSDYGSTVLANP
jgi:CheY-like chemotaxis protein